MILNIFFMFCHLQFVHVMQNICCRPRYVFIKMFVGTINNLFCVPYDMSFHVLVCNFTCRCWQVREENPHLVLGNVAVARKMGFPEVILPGDVRNDLYLTLLSGEYSKGNKSTDKNVEVTVRVCNEKGQSIPVRQCFLDLWNDRYSGALLIPMLWQVFSCWLGTVPLDIELNFAFFV